MNFKFYKTQDEFRLGKYDDDFRSKLDFAKELVGEAVEKNIGFSYVVFDSWYSSSEFIEFIDEKNRKFITEIKANRDILFQHPLHRKTVWLNHDELVTLIKKHFWDKVGFTRYRGVSLPVYSFLTRLKNCSTPVKAFVVFSKWSDEDSKSAHILITNDLKLSHKKVVEIYMQRWGIDQAFRELKDTFCFDHYQVRHKEKIMRYWMLCALVFSLIYWIKLNG
ncbi:MAG: transposase, partial [Candidatus Omnitrophica bacterium]|nr:transposase [Candidatus Omnitrophota bacterium]